jgi:deoxyadenosine/deoxycytidine kinase
MIVELIGCTGAGKTSLARSLQRRGTAADVGGLESEVRMMYDLALDHAGMRRITNPSLANIVQDAAGLPFALAALRRRREFLLFAAETIERRFPERVDRANRLRGVVRRLGMYELARVFADRDVVLSDEGTLLLAYLYALTDEAYAESDLETFAACAPLPDLVVYVRASTDVLVERAGRRSDRRRQLGDKETVELERLITRTVEVFDRLVMTRALRGRVVEIDNSADGESPHLRAVDELAELVSERRLGPEHVRASAVAAAPEPA